MGGSQSVTPKRALTCDWGKKFNERHGYVSVARWEFYRILATYFFDRTQLPYITYITSRDAKNIFTEQSFLDSRNVRVILKYLPTFNKRTPSN